MTSCNGQSQPPQEGITDTAGFLDPNPDNNSYGSADMFKNCVLLNRKPYGLVVQGSPFSLQSDEDLHRKIKAERGQIVKSKFYVLIDSSLAFGETLRMVNYLKQAGIGNYKVLNVESFFRRSEPVIVEQPSTVTTTIKEDIHDGSYFLLTISNEKIELNLFNKKIVLKDSSGVDSFIKANKASINPDKIQIIAGAKTAYEKLDPIITVLGKNGYTRFRMLTR